MADQQPGNVPAAGPDPTSPAAPTGAGPDDPTPPDGIGTTAGVPVRWSGSAAVPPTEPKRPWWSRRRATPEPDDRIATPAVDPWADQDTPWDELVPLEPMPPTRQDLPEPMPPTRMDRPEPMPPTRMDRPEPMPPTRLDRPEPMPPTRLERAEPVPPVRQAPAPPSPPPPPPAPAPARQAGPPLAAPAPTGPPPAPPRRRRWGRNRPRPAPAAPAPPVNRLPVAARPAPPAGAPKGAPRAARGRPLPPPTAWRPPAQRPLPPPPRRRRRWPRRLALFTLAGVACCCGVPAYFSWPAARQHPVTAALPDTVADLSLRSDRASTRAADRLADGLRAAGAGNVFAGVYGDRNGKRVTIAGTTGFRLTPQADVEAELDRLAAAYDVRDVVPFDAGETGVHERCGVGRANGGTVVVCAWADHGSLATVLTTRRSVDDSAELTGVLRSAVLTKG